MQLKPQRTRKRPKPQTMWKRSKGQRTRPKRSKPKRTTKREMKINWTFEDSYFASEKDNRNPIAHCKSVGPRNQTYVFNRPLTVDRGYSNRFV